MSRRALRLMLVACVLMLAGCGSSGSTNDPDSVAAAYLNIEEALINGDSDACSMMSGDYQNKLAASAQKFAADCPEVVKEVQKGFKEDPDLKTTSIEDVKVNGEQATLTAHSTYDGEDVRTRAKFKRNAEGKWILNEDRVIDDAAPAAPLAAFRAYTTALRKGEGEKVCALSTENGKELMSRVLPQSHGNGQCEGAVPFLAVAASKQPLPEILGGEERGDTATLTGLQSDGEGVWVFRVVVMKREDGEWRFDAARDLGRAPAPKAPSSPVT